jgi:hypothetical protein
VLFFKFVALFYIGEKRIYCKEELGRHSDFEHRTSAFNKRQPQQGRTEQDWAWLTRSAS